MSIIFKRIKVKNFLSIEKCDLKILPGKHLILGQNLENSESVSNGAGKSSLLEAVPWCIYGFTCRFEISRDGNGDCEVEVEFSKNNKNYRIKRFNGDSKEGNSALIFCDEEDITPRLQRQANSDILGIIGIPQDLFISAITIPQGVPINFSELSKTVRKSIIEEILGLNQWDEMRPKFSSAKSTKRSSINALESSFNIKKEKMIALNTEIETTEKIADTQDQELLVQLREHKNNYKTVLDKIGEIEKAIKAVTHGKLIKEIENLTDSLSTSKTLIIARISDLEKIILESICPSCKQIYPSSMIKSAEEELSLLKEKISTILQQLEEETKTIHNYHSLKEKRKILQRESVLTNSSIETFTERISTPKIDTTEKKEKLTKLNELVNEMNSQLQLVKDEENHLDFICKVLLPSSEFRTNLLKRYLVIINSYIKDISPIFTKDKTITLETDKSNKGVEITIKTGNKMSRYQNLSGGEKKRIDVILILSLQRFLLESSGQKTNLIVFDEIFNFLDKPGIQQVINSIDIIFPGDTCVFVITHEDSLKTQFSSFIEVIKNTLGISEVNFENYN